jgi:3-dehydroquinate dehydratase-1
MICVSISHLEEISSLLVEEVSLVELRLDHIGLDPAEIYPLLPGHWKTVATCRPGKQEISTRLDWLKKSMDLGATYVDMELESEESYLRQLKEHAERCGTLTMVSYHNFEETPAEEELAELLGACFDRGGEIAKVATLVRTSADLRSLISLYNLPGRKVVVGMGTLGRITRVIAPYLGSEFTFTSPRGGMETAPGQLDLRQLQDIYKVIGNQ